MRVAHLIRKPISREAGTVAKNVLEHGTGGINIDASRIAADGPGETRVVNTHSQGKNSHGRVYSGGAFDELKEDHQTEGQKLGRWPSNLVLIHKPGCQQVGIKTVKGDPRDTGGPLGGTRPGGFVNVGSALGGDKPVSRVYGGETIEAWDCVEGCPVRELDEQSIQGGIHPSGNSGNAPGSGLGYGSGTTSARLTPKGYPDGSAGASRFFKQVKP